MLACAVMACHVSLASIVGYPPRVHGVPPDLDLSALAGHPMVQFCVDQAHQLILNFDPGGRALGRMTRASIGIEGKWELRDADGTLLDQRHKPESTREAYRIHRLLGRTIESWLVLSPFAFEITFTGGFVIRVIDDDPRYEFCSIELPDRKSWYL